MQPAQSIAPLPLASLPHLARRCTRLSEFPVEAPITNLDLCSETFDHSLCPRHRQAHPLPDCIASAAAGAAALCPRGAALATPHLGSSDRGAGRTLKALAS